MFILCGKWGLTIMLRKKAYFQDMQRRTLQIPTASAQKGLAGLDACVSESNVMLNRDVEDAALDSRPLKGSADGGQATWRVNRTTRRDHVAPVLSNTTHAPFHHTINRFVRFCSFCTSLLFVVRKQQYLVLKRSHKISALSAQSPV